MENLHRRRIRYQRRSTGLAGGLFSDLRGDNAVNHRVSQPKRYQSADMEEQPGPESGDDNERLTAQPFHDSVDRVIQ